MNSGIYKIDLGPKQYVGQAVNLEGRWRRHYRELAQGIHHNAELQDYYDLGHRPKFSIVCHCPRWQLDALEAGWGRLLSNTEQDLPRLRPASFLPAFHPATLIDWALMALFGVVMTAITQQF
jgi:hypothetical protein